MRTAPARALAPALTAALALFSAPVLADVPKVVTDIPAVHALTAAVMGNLGEPTLLLDRGANAHSFQLRPSQAAALAAADLVVWIGPEMTPWLDRALRATAGKAEVVGLLGAEGTFRRAYAEDHAHGDAPAPAPKAAAATHDHDHGTNKAEDDDHAHGNDDMHEGVDPHAWLDPANAKTWLALIAEELAHNDAANAATYAANAAAAAARIDALDAYIAATLAPVKDRAFVVFHDAYGYFADHYGLTVAGSVALGDAAATGAARLAELRGMLTAGDVVCAFPEAQHDARLVATVVEGTLVRIGAPLDPSGSSLEPGAGLYEALLTALATSIADCLGRPS